MLSKKSKYAIHALVYIAQRKEAGPISAKQISADQHIPLKFLEAILLDLRNAGIVDSKKGRGGGFTLSRNPEEIHMAEIARLFDGAIALIPCVTHRFYERCEECVDEATCGIREVFLGIRNETVRQLKAATLAAILQKEQFLIQNPGQSAPFE